MTAADPDTDPAAKARSLLRAADRAVLATIDRRGGGPYASLVLLATAAEGAPILLISRLAEHTRNLEADPRASLLIDGSAGHRQPLEGPRVTLTGTAARLDGGAAGPARSRFLARHPDSRRYADFGDFAIWRIAVGAGHLVAGFGRIAGIEGDALLPGVDDASALIAAEAEIVDHMNADHGDAVDLYARVLLGREGAGWRITGIDPEGADLRRDGAVARLAFDRRVTSPDQARAALVRLAKRARAA